MELSGLEPLTSCMPWEMLMFIAVACWPEMACAAQCRIDPCWIDGQTTVEKILSPQGIYMTTSHAQW